jgi:dTDP-4-amino-4,6-dideoxygalactose transaminase
MQSSGTWLSADRASGWLWPPERQPADYYEHTETGFSYRRSYRLSNVLTALGRAQLSRLDGMFACRREIREMYVEGLSDVPGVRFLGRDHHERGPGSHEDHRWLASSPCSSRVWVRIDE